MKLSEALRLGAMAVPAKKGPIVSMQDGRICGACAIGTAVIAAGAVQVVDGQWRYNHEDGSRDVFPLLDQRGVTPPIPEICWDDVFGIVAVLFEHYDWTREQIADWIESIEQSLESQVSRVLSPGEEEQKEESLVAYGRTSDSDRG